jgi:hypothetical protein
MPTCCICKRNKRRLKFQTEHIAICVECVNLLNAQPSNPVKSAENWFFEKLKRGIERRANKDLQSNVPRKMQKGLDALNNLDAVALDRLHGWITRLLDRDKTGRVEFKIMRAHRRGLLRREGKTDYPGNWDEVAQKIRQRDGYICQDCGATETTLDVHHIVYLSNHGTNQRSNLITLCRQCHEEEHGRPLGFGNPTPAPDLQATPSKPATPDVVVATPDVAKRPQSQPLAPVDPVPVPVTKAAAPPPQPPRPTIATPLPPPAPDPPLDTPQSRPQTAPQPAPAPPPPDLRERYRRIALLELHSGQTVPALWKMALDAAAADPEKAKAHYAYLRVDYLERGIKLPPLQDTGPDSGQEMQLATQSDSSEKTSPVALFLLLVPVLIAPVLLLLFWLLMLLDFSK